MWIARDKNGWLFLHEFKPHRDSDEWLSDNTESCGSILGDLFPNLKFEDEPIEVELRIKEAS